MANMSDRVVQTERHRGGDRDGNGKQCDAVREIVQVDVTRRWSDLGERKHVFGVQSHLLGERTVPGASEVRAKA